MKAATSCACSAGDSFSMRLPLLTFPLIFLLPIFGAASARADAASLSAPHDVGVTTREFADPARRDWAGTGPRPIRATLWYPSSGGGQEEDFESEGETTRLRRDGEIASTKALPLILVSHGSGGNVAQMFWLGRTLAQRGFIVLAVDHNGTPEEELHTAPLTLSDFFGWERPRDLSIALDQVLAEPALAGRIDRERIGAAGFSLGATTALWLAGARLDPDSLRANSPPPPPFLAAVIEQRIAFSTTNPLGREAAARASLSHRDPRVRAVFALAPPMGAGFTAEGLREVAVPVHIAVGDGDLVAPSDGNAKHFAQHIANAQLTVLPGERGHYLAPIPAEQRRAELREVADLACAFFERELR